MSPELAEIVEQAYELFAPYQISKPLDVCTFCCVTKEEEHQLATLNVRHIPQQLLHTWNHAAKSERPDPAEFKHFLPRFLDLVSHFDWPSYSVELCLKGFRDYGPSDWTAKEHSLIDAFGRAYFTYCLRSHDLFPGATLDQIIIMLRPTGLNLDMCLQAWESEEHKQAAIHFGLLVPGNIGGGKKGGYRNSFADPELKQKLSNWITRPKVRAHFCSRLEDIVLNDPELDDDLRAELSLSYEQLQLLS